MSVLFTKQEKEDKLLFGHLAYEPKRNHPNGFWLEYLSCFKFSLYIFRAHCDNKKFKVVQKLQKQVAKTRRQDAMDPFTILL